MSEHPKGPEQSGRKYEDSSVSVKQLFWFAVGVVAMVLAGVLISAGVFRFFNDEKMMPMGPAASPFEDVRQIPSGPRLQTEAPKDLKTYRDDQEKILSGYGWVDPQAGVVRIPVDRAMELLLQKGYPVRGSGPAEDSTVKSAKQAASTPHHQVGSTSTAAKGKHP